MTSENTSGLTPTISPDPDRPDSVILHLPYITYLDTQVWSADIGLSEDALAALRLALTEGEA